MDASNPLGAASSLEWELCDLCVSQSILAVSQAVAGALPWAADAGRSHIELRDSEPDACDWLLQFPIM